MLFLYAYPATSWGPYLSDHPKPGISFALWYKTIRDTNYYDILITLGERFRPGPLLEQEVRENWPAAKNLEQPTGISDNEKLKLQFRSRVKTVMIHSRERIIRRTQSRECTRNPDGTHQSRTDQQWGSQNLKTSVSIFCWGGA